MRKPRVLRSAVQRCAAAKPRVNAEKLCFFIKALKKLQK
jgi:hypothetical protein